MLESRRLVRIIQHEGEQVIMPDIGSQERVTPLNVSSLYNVKGLPCYTTPNLFTFYFLPNYINNDNVNLDVTNANEFLIYAVSFLLLSMFMKFFTLVKEWAMSIYAKEDQYFDRVF